MVYTYKFSQIVEKSIEDIFYNYDVDKGRKSFDSLKVAAGGGDADAMYLLARCYGGRDFVWKYFDFPEDDDLLEKYMQSSILNGSAIGVIGSMRAGALTEELESKMPFKSIKEAWEIVHQRANEGCAFCQNMIGNSYYWLDIVRINNIDYRDYQSQKQWLSYLGDMMRKSIPWYEKAFLNGMGFAGRNLVNMYQKGEKDLVEPCPEKAIEICKLGAELGFPEWLESYGIYLIENHDDKKIEGVELCRQAAEKGNKAAWYQVAAAYYYGEIFERNLKKSLQAANNAIGYIDDGYCCKIAGAIYLSGGDGVQQDYFRAVSLLEKGLKDTDTWGNGRLAFCYAQGLGCTQNVNKALKLIEDCEYYSEYSNYTLGFLYTEGLGVPKDIKKGISYWKEDEEDFPLSKQALSKFKRTWYGKWVRVKDDNKYM